MDFQGKVIIITGASSGIGADAARHLANLGGKIALVGRNKKRLNEVAEQIEKDGNQSVLAIVADVTKDAQRIIDETIDEFGRLDVLVNNAGNLLLIFLNFRFTDLSSFYVKDFSWAVILLPILRSVILIALWILI